MGGIGQSFRNGQLGRLTTGPTRLPNLTGPTRCGSSLLRAWQLANHMTMNDRQQLLKALLSKIDEARLAPEARLPGERELAQSFGASRSSLREVLRVLEAPRLIERRPQSGIYVRPAVSEPSLEALVLQEALDVRSSTASFMRWKRCDWRRRAARLMILLPAVDRVCILARGAISPTTMRPFIWP